MGSGYTSCKCRDCFDVAVSNDMDNPDFCGDCEDAGCEEDAECVRDDAYGDEDLDFSCEQCKKDQCCSAESCCRLD